MNFSFLVAFIVLAGNALNLDLCRILSFGKELTLFQTTNFRLFQTQGVGRPQFLNLIEIAGSSPFWWKTLLVKEILLVTSNFSFLAPLAEGQ